jgi:hypothetical protein
MLPRLLAVLGLALVTFAALGLRLAAAPSGAGYRLAMAAAPAGGLYLADGHGHLLLLDQAGRVAGRFALPTASPLALAAGDTLVLGADDGVFVSPDSGRSWKRAAPTGRRFLAVAALGPHLAAAAWAGVMWVSNDAGSTWQRSQLPAEATEIESIAFGSQGGATAGSLTGILTSADSGLTWLRQPGPARVTSVGWQGAAAFAATWDGRLFEARAGDWRESGRLPAGVWAYEPGQQAAATVSGLYLGGRQSLAGREVVAFADSDGVLYAGLAGGMVEASGDGRAWHRVFQP